MPNISDLIENPYRLIGVPFADGGRGPDGLDCWGLALEVFRRYGYELPDYKIACLDASSIDQAISNDRQHWVKLDPAGLVTPALVVIKFNHVILCNHTGVYIGEGKFIHAREPIGVNIDRIDSPAWRRKIEGFYIPGPDAVRGKGTA